MQGRIERAFFDTQKCVGSALNMQHDPVSVQVSHLGERLKDKQVE
jgi:hypothetical protein